MTAVVEKTIKERPILFSGPMIRAILDNKKTQTRRVVKPQPSDSFMLGVDWSKYWVRGKFNQWDKALWIRNPENGGEIYCPYGQPGERLWVRETWNTWGPPERQTLDFAATCPDAKDLKWRPSIFMPRWASRITLEVINVRVERLNQISSWDIECEGTPINPMDQPVYRNDHFQRRKDFKYLWDSINDKRGYGWESNPWVWVVEFRKVGGRDN